LSFLTAPSRRKGGAAQNPYAFKAGINDRASGLVKFGYRWYNPVTGTWTQQDTLDSPLDPGNANRYGFAALDPINNADPTGRDWACVGSTILFLVAATTTVVSVATSTATFGATLGLAALGAAGTFGAYLLAESTCGAVIGG
jgi:RHS repeat-associated protein